MIVGATGDVGVIVTGASDGSSIAGNFIGTDRQGAAGLGNDQGVRVIGATGKATIGPGNTITGNTTDGVQIDTSSGQRIVANSIFGNGGKGILIDPGANDDITAPVITDATTAGGTTTGHGTFQGSPNGAGLHRVLQQPDRDPNGSGQNYLGSITATADGNGSGQFSFSFPTGPGIAFLTATTTDTTTRGHIGVLELSRVDRGRLALGHALAACEPGHRPHRRRLAGLGGLGIRQQCVADRERAQGRRSGHQRSQPQ